ncbi:hypothetical protein [Raineyella antarctica]|uniref:hypothetical protein n=1 Tax=Raineyella antarctica TaxID=1577474 RepID=UPI001114D04A|nr:hypothetical protein [Raineyella antarctica]
MNAGQVPSESPRPNQPNSYGQVNQPGPSNQQNPYGQGNQPGAYGQPNQQGPYGQPNQQGPYGQPNQQGPYGQPNQPGSYDPRAGSAYRLPAEQHGPGGLVDPADARATLEARKELGPDMDQALVDSFTARVEQALVARGGFEEAERQRQADLARVESKNQMVLGIVSLSLAIPLTAIFAGISGLLGGIIVWVGIVLVNMAYAMRKGHRGPESHS